MTLRQQQRHQLPADKTGATEKQQAHQAVVNVPARLRGLGRLWF
jgi:hypothetical protein